MKPNTSLVDLFNEAIEREDTAERARFLDEACEADAALRERVEKLLHAHADAGGFFSKPFEAQPVRGRGNLLVPVTEKPGDMIGRYKLLQQIGEGGCGVVYMAEQAEPVRRRVALKVIKLGMDTKQVIARFEAERQALALMDHPNISKVYDAGATDTGRPYFVMELVRGVKITEFCDENKLSTGTRLKLFIQVCQAIQHAHQKGIIHRDIKPSNILVTINDGVPVPKVIDFGIAKATAGRLTDQTLFTAFEQFIGTPAYMSPEQAVMTSLDIDTRSDIYSLGVLLYELLTGGPPFDQKELLAAGLDGMRQTIREAEPPRPSNRLSTMAVEALTKAALRHQTEPPRLIHQVSGDLDWIAMKCLEKDRARRYETANALAADIHRHLDCEPVLARPPSRLYEFQKSVRRHKFGFAAATALILLLMLGVLVSSWQALRAVRAEREQSQLRQAAQRSASQADDQARRADQSAVEAQEQRKRAEALTEENRRSLYAARIKLTSQAIAEGDVPHAQELLEGLQPAEQMQDLRSFDWYYLHHLASSEKTALTQVGGRVRSVVFSPDSRLLAAAGGDPIVRIWDAKTHLLKAELRGHEGPVAAVAFSSDGDLLASVGAKDGVVCLWNAAEARLLDRLQAGSNGLVVLAFSPDGSRLATGEGGLPGRWGNPLTRYAQCSEAGRIQLWNMKTRQIERILDTQNHDALALKFSPDGRQLAMAGVHNSLMVFDVATGKSSRVQASFPGPVFDVLYLTNQELVAASWNPYQDSGRITTFNAATLEQSRVMLDSGKVTCLALSPDGRTIATAGPDRITRLRDALTGQETGVFHGHKAEIWSVAFSPDGASIATGGFDNAIRIWDTTAYVARQRIKIPHAFSVAFSPDGKRIACGAGGVIQIRDALTGALIRVLTDYASGTDTRVTFSPDGSLVAATGADHKVHFWDVQTWRHWVPQAEDLSPPSNQTLFVPDNQFTFSRDSSMLARAGMDGVIRVFDSRSGALRNRLDHRAFSLSYSPDGTRLFSAGWSEVVVWDARTSRVERKLPESGALLRHSEDGRWLAARNGDHVNIFELPGLKLVRTLRAHREVIYCLNFSHDGKILATASWDGTVKLWQVATGHELLTIPSHSGVVWSVAFSPDDRTLAFASGGQEVQILRCASVERLAKQAQEHAVQSLIVQADRMGMIGDWKQALAAASQLVVLEPTSHQHYQRQATLFVALQDAEGHRLTCQKIQTRFGDTPDPVVAERIARICLTLPSCGVDADTIAAWVETAFSKHSQGALSPWNQSLKGLSEYRRGNFAAAADWQEKVLKNPQQFASLNAQAHIVLAMSHWQLRQPDSARASLVSGANLIKQKPAAAQAGDLGWEWIHWIAAQALHQEASDLIEENVPAVTSGNGL